MGYYSDDNAKKIIFRIRLNIDNKKMMKEILNILRILNPMY